SRLCPLVGLALLAYDLDKISDGEMDIDQMQAPIGLDLSADHYVTGDVIHAGTCGIAMNCDSEIGTLVIGNALSRQQTWDADKRRVHWLGRIYPGLWFDRCSVDNAAAGRQVRMQLTPSASQGCGIRAA